MMSKLAAVLQKRGKMAEAARMYDKCYQTQLAVPGALSLRPRDGVSGTDMDVVRSGATTRIAAP